MERFIEEVWNKGNLEVADEIFHPQASSPSAPTLPLGAEGVKFIVNMMRNAFSDYWMEITHIVAEDDRVAARFRQGGTHDGDLMGIAPTGKKVEWTEIGILRIADGKVVESWYDVDMLGPDGPARRRRLRELSRWPRQDVIDRYYETANAGDWDAWLHAVHRRRRHGRAAGRPRRGPRHPARR